MENFLERLALLISSAIVALKSLIGLIGPSSTLATLTLT